MTTIIIVLASILPFVILTDAGIHFQIWSTFRHYPITKLTFGNGYQRNDNLFHFLNIKYFMVGKIYKCFYKNIDHNKHNLGTLYDDLGLSL